MPKNKALTKALFAPARPDGNKKAQPDSPIVGEAAGDSGRLFDLASFGSDFGYQLQIFTEMRNFGTAVFADKESLGSFGKRYLEVAVEFEHNIDTVFERCMDLQTDPISDHLRKKIDALYSELNPAKDIPQGTVEALIEKVRVLNAEFKRIIASKDSGAAKTKVPTTNDVINGASKGTAEAATEVSAARHSTSDDKEEPDSHVIHRFYSFGSLGLPADTSIHPFCKKFLELAAEFKRVIDKYGYAKLGSESDHFAMLVRKEVDAMYSEFKRIPPIKDIRQEPLKAFAEKIRVLLAELLRLHKSGDVIQAETKESDDSTSDDSTTGEEEESDCESDPDYDYLYTFGTAFFVDKEWLGDFGKKYLDLAAEYKRIADMEDNDKKLMEAFIKKVVELYSDHTAKSMEQVLVKDGDVFNEYIRVLNAEFKRILASKGSGAAETKPPTTNDDIDVPSKESVVAEKATSIDSDPMKKDSEADDVVEWKFDHVIKSESDDVTVEASTLKQEFEAIDVNYGEEWHDVAEEAGGSATGRKSCTIS